MRTYQYTGGDRDEINLRTFGKLFKKNGKYFVVYEETELTGYEGSTTTIKIESDQMTMTRMGKYKSKMIFKRGEKFLSYCETPYGTVPVAICPKKVDISFSDMGGNLEIEYTLDMNNDEFATNILYMEITSLTKYNTPETAKFVYNEHTLK